MADLRLVSLVILTKKYKSKFRRSIWNSIYYWQPSDGKECTKNPIDPQIKFSQKLKKDWFLEFIHGGKKQVCTQTTEWRCSNDM